jgi:hypothetical protein
MSEQHSTDLRLAPVLALAPVPDLRSDFAIAVEEVRRLGQALGLEAVHIWPQSPVRGIGLSAGGESVNNYCDDDRSVLDLLAQLDEARGKAALPETMY